MADTDSFCDLMKQLDAGEDAAARQVFNRFARRLVALARRRIDRRIAHRIDPEDVVQSAFKSFFVRQREGTLKIGDWDSLWSLLTLITVRKCIDRAGYLRAEKRDAGREAWTANGKEQPWQLALDREPSPEEAAILAETIEHLFMKAREDEIPILELSLQGYTAVEIGLRLGRALRSVQRLREQIRKELERIATTGMVACEQ